MHGRVALLALVAYCLAAPAAHGADDQDACLSPGDFDARLAACSRAIEKGDATGEVGAKLHYNRAQGHMQRRRHDLAIADLTAAIRHLPEFPPAYNERGIAHFREKRYQRAIEDFSEAIRLVPDWPGAHEWRGRAHLKLGDHDGALRDYRKARDLAASSGTPFLVSPFLGTEIMRLESGRR